MCFYAKQGLCVCVCVWLAPMTDDKVVRDLLDVQEIQSDIQL